MQVFMSCNLISGMYQRLDSMRKGAFASACIFGEDNNNTISGIWIWRGQDLAFTVSFTHLNECTRYMNKTCTYIYLSVFYS